MLPFDELIRLGDVFIIAFAAAAISSFPIYRLLIAWKSRQTVSEYLPEHQRKQGTPTMGGLIILVGILVSLVAHGMMGPSGPPLDVPRFPSITVAAIFLVAAFGLIGFADDFLVPRFVSGKRGLGWKQKILLQIVFGAAASGYLFRDMGLSFWATLFLILFFANAYNFADGLDGLAGSLLLAFGLGLAALASHSGAPLDVKVLIAASMAATIPFLFLNSPPAKVFMGDVGSLPIGAALGLIVSLLLLVPQSAGAYWLYPHPNWLAVLPQKTAWEESVYLIAPLVVASFVMIAELVPVPLQILSVKLFKRRLFTMTPIHHAFEAKGWPESRIVWTFALVQLLLSGTALYLYVRLVDMSHPRIDSRYHYYDRFSPDLGGQP